MYYTVCVGEARTATDWRDPLQPRGDESLYGQVHLRRENMLYTNKNPHVL